MKKKFIEGQLAIQQAKNKFIAFLSKKIKGEGYFDTVIKIIIAIVIGGLLLVGLYALFDKNFLPSIGKKVTDMFNYAG